MIVKYPTTFRGDMLMTEWSTPEEIFNYSIGFIFKHEFDKWWCRFDGVTDFIGRGHNVEWDRYVDHIHMDRHVYILMGLIFIHMWILDLDSWINPWGSNPSPNSQMVLTNAIQKFQNIMCHNAFNLAVCIYIVWCSHGIRKYSYKVNWIYYHYYTHIIIFFFVQINLDNYFQHIFRDC